MPTPAAPAAAPAGQVLAHAYDHIDLPPIKPVTTRINLHRAQCPCCKKRVAAAPPAGMAPGSPFGPGIVAIAAYLHGRQMVSYTDGQLQWSRRGVRRHGRVEDFRGRRGQHACTHRHAARRSPLAAEAKTIAEIVRNSPVIASDETLARVCRKTHWQWLFASASAVYHTIVPARGKCVPVAFPGGIKPKVWISDRLAAQGTHAKAHQFCLAHLIRDALDAIDAGGRIFAPLSRPAASTAGAPSQASAFCSPPEDQAVRGEQLRLLPFCSWCRQSRAAL